MYYPIIDKLKELMADITSVKEKEPLIIVGTVTSESGGTWEGDWNDMVSAFNNNKPVYFKVQVIDSIYIIPLVGITSHEACSGIFYFNSMMVYGTIRKVGTFSLIMVQ